MDIPGLLSNQPQQNQLANLLRGVTGLLDTARPKAQNVLAGLLGGYADKYLGKPLNNLLGISPEAEAETKAMMNSPAVQMGMNLMPLGMISSKAKLAGLLDNTGMPATTIYHGTTPESAKLIERKGFDLSKSADGSIWFTSNPNIGDVAASGKGGIVKRGLDESKLKLGGWDHTDKYSTDELISMGYDGLKLPDGEGGFTYQIFNPEKLSK